MAKTKVAVTLDSQTLRRVDRLVRDARYPNRSQAIEAAVAAQLERLEHRRLADECAKLDPAAERAMAEEGLGLDAAGWPEYRGARSAGRISIPRVARNSPASARF